MVPEVTRRASPRVQPEPDPAAGAAGARHGRGDPGRLGGSVGDAGGAGAAAAGRVGGAAVPHRWLLRPTPPNVRGAIGNAYLRPKIPRPLSAEPKSVSGCDR